MAAVLERFSALIRSVEKGVELGGKMRLIEGAGRKKWFPVKIGEAEIIQPRRQQSPNARRIGCGQSCERLKNGLMRRMR